MAVSLLERFPLRLMIGGEDVSHLIDNGITFSNSDPGGFEAASVQVPKDMPDTLVGQDVCLECGLGTAWEGRIAEVQRSLGARTTLTCEGYGAIYKENTVQVIFVDRDLSRWGPPSVQRKILLLAANYSMTEPSVQPDATSGYPSLLCEIDGGWTSPMLPLVEGWYDAAGLDIASIYYAWKQSTLSANPNFSWDVGGANDDIASAFDFTFNLNAAGPGSGTLSLSADRKFGFVQLGYPFTNSGQDGATYPMWWTCLAVYGNHGLTKRGSNSFTDAQGFFAGDIAGWVTTQNSEIAAGVISDATGYVIPHLVYLEPATLETIIADASQFIGCHWGVWESLNRYADPRPRLDFRPYPTAATAWCRRDDCTVLDINEQLAGLYDTAVVTYADPQAGTTRAVTVTTTNPLLVAAGQTGRTIIVNGGTMTAARARDFGALMLVLLLLQARVAGEMTIFDTINGPSGELPAYLLKAGLDRLRVIDLPGSDILGSTNDLPIKRVETTISNDGLATNVEIGTGADLIETLQARLSETATILGV